MLDLYSRNELTAWKKQEILIVDNEPAIIEELETVLKLEGYIVRTALSGETALEILNEFDAKVIISDQKMDGGISGTTFLSKVRMLYPEKITMILSAFSEQKDLMSAINDANIYQYILKPWDEEGLIKKINDALIFSHTKHEKSRIAHTNTHYLKKVIQQDLVFLKN